MNRLKHGVEPVVVDQVDATVNAIVTGASREEKPVGWGTSEAFKQDFERGLFVMPAAGSRYRGATHSDQDDDRGESDRQQLFPRLRLLKGSPESAGDKNAGENDGLDAVVNPGTGAHP